MYIPEPKQLKNGLYFIQLRLNGVSIPVSAPTKTECKRQATLIKAEHAAGKKPIIKSELTLREACERHIQRKEKAGRSPETIRTYNNIVNNRFQNAMSRKVTSIKDWQEVYNEEVGRLSAKTMQTTWGFIKSVCKAECGVTIPGVEAKECKGQNECPFLDTDQIKVFVAAIKGHRYEIPMLLELSSCRASEVSALDWKNIDLKNKRIQIAGALVRDKNNKYVEKKENKTASSTRVIPIFIPELQTALENVSDKTGKVVTARPLTIRNSINKICAANGLPLVGNHGLRHSFASLAYSLNVPIKIAMQIGGWDDYNTMLKIYTHLSQRDINKYTDELSQFFNENANGNANKAPDPLQIQ